MYYIGYVDKVKDNLEKVLKSFESLRILQEVNEVLKVLLYEFGIS